MTMNPAHMWIEIKNCTDSVVVHTTSSIFFDGDVAGQSLRAGGATLLAEVGTPHLIQASGRWKTNTLEMYIWKDLLQALLSARRR